ncbi:hypothetical protein EC957_005723 [Mortierella hygrophila]|uniref:Uncharacterized protein n=1 Tax=Mortierella hygrophila TaxID=979708 RepID=A0A9P6FDG9_9FUNG|nr:hypothetical protein EC957_005723 [Mortierella hygrophila]
MNPKPRLPLKDITNNPSIHSNNHIIQGESTTISIRRRPTRNENEPPRNFSAPINTPTPQTLSRNSPVSRQSSGSATASYTSAPTPQALPRNRSTSRQSSSSATSSYTSTSTHQALPRNSPASRQTSGSATSSYTSTSTHQALTRNRSTSRQSSSSATPNHTSTPTPQTLSRNSSASHQSSGSATSSYTSTSTHQALTRNSPASRQSSSSATSSYTSTSTHQALPRNSPASHQLSSSATPNYTPAPSLELLDAEEWWKLHHLDNEMNRIDQFIPPVEIQVRSGEKRQREHEQQQPQKRPRHQEEQREKERQEHNRLPLYGRSSSEYESPSASSERRFSNLPSNIPSLFQCSYPPLDLRYQGAPPTTTLYCAGDEIWSEPTPIQYHQQWHEVSDYLHQQDHQLQREQQQEPAYPLNLLVVAMEIREYQNSQKNKSGQGTDALFRDGVEGFAMFAFQ